MNFYAPGPLHILCPLPAISPYLQPPPPPPTHTHPRTCPRAQCPTSKVPLSCSLSWYPPPSWLPTAFSITCYSLQSEYMCYYFWPLLLKGWNLINVLSQRMWGHGGEGGERSALTW